MSTTAATAPAPAANPPAVDPATVAAATAAATVAATAAAPPPSATTDHGNGEEASSSSVLWLVLCLCIAGAIALPLIVWGYSGDWINSDSVGILFAKFLELGLVATCGVLLIMKGATLITASEKGHAEGLGSSLLVLGGLLLGGLFVFLAANVDTYSTLRHLVIAKSQSGTKKDPKVSYDTEKNTVTFEFTGNFLWVAITRDMDKDFPVKRRSEILYTFERNGNVGSWKLPDDEKGRVERIGVFYGTGEGPSGEHAWVKPPAAPAAPPPAEKK